MKIYLNHEGVLQFNKLLEKKKEELLKNSTASSSSIQNAIGDGWHDNFDAEQSLREEYMITHNIEKLLKMKQEIELLEEKRVEGAVCINDVLKIKIIYDEDDTETSIIKLTGKYLPEPNPNYEEITLNSPLGSAIYLKPIPSQTHYEVNERKITVEIKEKIIAE